MLTFNARQNSRSFHLGLASAFGLALFVAVLLPMGAIRPTGLALAQGSITRYVAPTPLGHDSGNCTASGTPCATIGYALSQAGDGNTILVAAGTYAENLYVTKTVTLKGGYEPVGWSRSLYHYTTIISGSGNNAVIRVQSMTLSQKTEINGLMITNGDLITGIGGISVLSSSVGIDNCRIVHNHSTGSGGGIRIDRSVVTITNTIIADNEADHVAGAIYIVSPSTPRSLVYIINSTIVNNRAGGVNGIFVSLSGCEVINSIVWGHELEDFDGFGHHATYSNIEMGLPGVGNISEDPRFVAPASGNYHLRPDSPCIDAGTNLGAPGADFEGGPRPIDGDRDGAAVTDIGFDEFASSPQIIRDQFYVQGQRYVIKGLNYYEKDHAWDLFWPYWCANPHPASVTHELDLAHGLGVNTLRIFLRWDFFSPNTPAVTLEARKRCLDELIELAAARQMKVLPTLFDGMPNEGVGSLYRTPAVGVGHLDSLLTPFANRGVTVDFSKDSRILAWDIKNEPDRDYSRDANGDGQPGRPNDVAAVQSWADAIIEHLRAKDTSHPITVGVYGAVMSGTTWVYSPTLVGYYASVITHSVDFLSMHYSLDEKNFPADVNAVEAVAGGKPIVVEEFALHTWADSPSDPHKMRDQAAYYNAILSTAEADHLAGAMFWTLTDLSHLMRNDDERLKYIGILHNHLIPTGEVPAPTDYGEKPAAAVVREHFKPSVAYLDTFDGYALVIDDNCDPPLGWADNRAANGGVIMTCAPTTPHVLFTPDQIGQARLTKLGGPDGVITSPVLEKVNVDLSPQLIVNILTYTVRNVGDNRGPVDLDIGVKATGEAPIWLASDLVASGVNPITGLKLPQTIYAALPAGWPTEQDFQVIFRLQDHVPGNTGYSAGFESGFTKIGTCPSAPPSSVKLGGGIQKLFRDNFSGRAIDATQWDTVHGNPYLFNCGAVLTTTRVPAAPVKTELRSHRLFTPKSMLVIRATTQNWRGENKQGDTSFGFEGWYTNCHNAVIVTSNGQLGLIRPEAGVDCSQPVTPTQCYQPIQDWNTLRTEPHEFAILWTTAGVTLRIDGVVKATSAGCIAPAIPQVPLPVRLNANVFDETQPGNENQYDQDVLQVDYLYVPEGVALPIILKGR